MPIIADEPTGLKLAFDYLPFSITNGQADTIQTSPAISGDIYSGGTLINPEVLLRPTESFPLGGIDLYLYQLDLQGYARAKLTLDNFPAIGAAGVKTSATWQAEISGTLYDWLPDANNFERLVKNLNGIQIAGFTVIPGVPVNEQSPDLSQYAFSDADPNSPLKPLTEKPVASLISLGDSEWLPIWGEGITHVRVRTFDIDGQTIHDGQFETGYQSGDDPYVMQIGVGPANIDNMIPADFVYGDAVEMGTDVVSYTVQAGTTCNSGNNFIGFTERRKFFLKPSALRTARIHFINRFGFVDSFSVWNNLAESYKVTSETGSRGKRASDASTPGRYRVSVSAEKSYDLISSGITRDTQRWLATELARATRILLESSGKYYSVYLEDGDFGISDTEDTVPALAFTIIHSNKEYSQSA